MHFQSLENLILETFSLNGKLSRFGDHFTAPDGLSGSRWQILGALYHSEQPLTSPQLAEKTGMTRQGMQKQLNQLFEQGLLQLLENPHHKRSSQFALSEQGVQLYETITQRWIATATPWAEQFSQAELDTALSVLARFAQLLLKV